MDALVIAVIGIAVAQALMILLTIGRERNIKELREHVEELRQLVDEQRMRIVELRAWLAGRNATQPSRAKSEPESIREPIAKNIVAPEHANALRDLSERPRLTEDEMREMVGPDKAREIVAVLHGKPPEKP
jgi:UDP-N-acetylglucosamine 2-epimerase